MRKQFRCKTRKQTKVNQDSTSRVMLKYKQNSENMFNYEKLSFMDIQQITRSVLTDPKALQKNMGVISSIKGKMYCLKLGELSSSKDFSHYFFSRQFRNKQKRQEPLKKLSSNSMYNHSGELKELRF